MAQRLHTGFVFTFYLLLILNKVRCELVENRKVANTFCSIEKHMLPVGGKKKKSNLKGGDFFIPTQIGQFYINSATFFQPSLCPPPAHLGFSDSPPPSQHYHLLVNTFLS